jgi:uncharacterized membrane protein YeaQ/YmgE (transglycosylase-associated protein family)
VGIISWIVLGAIAGFAANFVMNQSANVFWTIVLGIVGAVVGGYISVVVFNRGDVTGLNLPSIVISILGAVLVLWIYRLLTSRKMSLD